MTPFRSRSFEVNDFGTNRQLMYDFLLVINTNLPPILHRLRDIAFDRSDLSRKCLNLLNIQVTVQYRSLQFWLVS